MLCFELNWQRLNMRMLHVLNGMVQARAVTAILHAANMQNACCSSDPCVHLLSKGTKRYRAPASSKTGIPIPGAGAAVVPLADRLWLGVGALLNAGGGGSPVACCGAATGCSEGWTVDALPGAGTIAALPGAGAEMLPAGAC